VSENVLVAFLLVLGTLLDVLSLEIVVCPNEDNK
jgi:hypothetical protein